ncbi:uncharacterized protein DUF3306 [Breoghania corrubedonensis]|uniref:Uncharacterized protein DUF3306 n=1 Tax=Breoghania corrubedonensis TaxID=665038 RepID=A0A2T5VAR6_9HYPH|nr:DUF3306 domain-containing protein [Breoghania corrubedonensis]PTW60838.1 uncharacterized protein DUF3306 [Breoghania corrubedonensis]
MSVEGEGVLSRWSRLKRGEKTVREHAGETEREVARDAGKDTGRDAGRSAGRGGVQEAAGDVTPADVLPSCGIEVQDAGSAAGVVENAGSVHDCESDDDAARVPVRMLGEDDLPAIDSLTARSDFTVFLQRNVPAHLHKLAMRKLWRSDPVLANLDGLNDYDTDYTIKEVWDIAAQSADDLARGAKRLTVSDLRAKETEARRKAEFERRGKPAASGRKAEEVLSNTPDREPRAIADVEPHMAENGRLSQIEREPPPQADGEADG